MRTGFVSCMGSAAGIRSGLPWLWLSLQAPRMELLQHLQATSSCDTLLSLGRSSSCYPYRASHGSACNLRLLLYCWQLSKKVWFCLLCNFLLVVGCFQNALQLLLLQTKQTQAPLASPFSCFGSGPLSDPFQVRLIPIDLGKEGPLKTGNKYGLTSMHRGELKLFLYGLTKYVSLISYIGTIFTCFRTAQQESCPSKAKP